MLVANLEQHLSSVILVMSDNDTENNIHIYQDSSGDMARNVTDNNQSTIGISDHFPGWI